MSAPRFWSRPEGRSYMGILLTLLLALPAFAAKPSETKPTPATPAPKAAPIQPLSVSTSVTPPKVMLGEPFTFTVVLTHKPDQRYELTNALDLGPFELTSQTRHREDHGDTSTTRFELKMALFQLGKTPLPALHFEVTDSTGVHAWELHTGSVEGISTLPPDAVKKGEALDDIKPNAPVPVRSWRLLWVLLGLLGAGVLGYAAYRALRKLRQRVLEPPPAPPRPLHERTIAALDALEADALPQNGRAREFYFRLSEILRGYLGERFRFEALECTSSELLVRVSALPFKDFPVGDFSSFVHESDLVKFAKSEPSHETCAGALEFAYRLVNQTHPPAVIPANALGPDVPQS